MTDERRAFENAARRELRGRILRIVEAGGQAGVDVIKTALKFKGVYADERAIVSALEYLADAGFATLKDCGNERSGGRYIIAKITAKGTDLIEGTIEHEGAGL